MKFNRIFALLVVVTILAAVASRRTRRAQRYFAYAPNQPFENASPATPDGDGEIFYLDRQDVTCPNSGMAFFQLKRQENQTKINYTTKCINSSAITLQAVTKYTPWNAVASDYKKSVQFLDRHDMNCDAGTVLSGFRLQRSDNGTGNQMRYKYTCYPAQTVCCSNLKTTSKQDMGNSSLVYLDRQQVGDFNTSNVVLKRAWLKTSYSPDQMWYAYEACQLADMDTINGIAAAEKQNSDIQSQLQAAQQEQATLTATNKQLMEQMAQLQAQLQASTQAVEASNAKVTQLTTQATAAQTNLGNLKATPSLTCSLPQ